MRLPSTTSSLLVIVICVLNYRVARAAPSLWPLQKFHDEFNSTITTTTGDGTQTNLAWLKVQAEIDSLNANHNSNQKATNNAKLPRALRKLLAQYELSPRDNCCPSWRTLTQNSEIQDEQRRFYGKTKTNQLKLVDLLIELKRAYANITLLSIDGQSGDNEQEKYYKFFDDVQYYLKLNRIAHNHLNEQQQQQVASAGLGNANKLADQSSLSSTVAGASGSKQQPQQQQPDASDETLEFKRYFRRQLKGIEFRISQDPTISSFLDEYSATIDESTNTNTANSSSGGKTESPFSWYESFIRYTQFGQHYAQNISLVRESVVVFDQVCSHLDALSFPSNLTRPSMQYEMIRRLSRELFLIRSELREQINERILENRHDIRRIFRRLDQLVGSRPEIRMLGDEFSSSPPHFSWNVRQLTRLLDLYTGNNLTELSFYDQLSELPEDFIMLGATIAHEYETREVPQYSRFDSDYYNWHFSRAHRPAYHHHHHHYDGEHSVQSNSTGSGKSGDARSQSNQSLLSRLLFN